MLEKRGWFFDLNQKRKGFGNFFNKMFASTVESSYLWTRCQHLRALHEKACRRVAGQAKRRHLIASLHAENKEGSYARR
mgnify:CR=1 FL=1